MTIIDDTPVRDLTTEQLAHVIASRRAIENAEPLPPLEWESRVRTAEERLFAFAQWARELGMDDALIGADLYRKLLTFGYVEADALDALRDVGIVWSPRTDEERLVHIAGEMLDSGWSEEQVAWAIDGLVSDGR